MRAVSVDVGHRLIGNEARCRVDLSGEIWVVDVDAGVEHRDRDISAVVASSPCGRCTDLRDALVKVGFDSSVEPQLLEAAPQAWIPGSEAAPREKDRRESEGPS